MMNVNVKFFAVSREITGVEQRMLVLPEGATVRDLTAELGAIYPGLASLHARFAVNLAYADGDARLNDGDEVACIPPVGGG